MLDACKSAVESGLSSLPRRVDADVVARSEAFLWEMLQEVDRQAGD